MAGTSVFVDVLSLGGSVGITLHNVLAVRRIGKLLLANISIAMEWLMISGLWQVRNFSMKIAETMAVLRTQPLRMPSSKTLCMTRRVFW